jgi:diguanylate cyclase (GGDEF)-like protein/PAS domain S-box-containing protein
MLDIRTLMLLYLVINLISAGAVAIIWRQDKSRFAGLSFWLADMILQAAGAVLVVLRGLVPDIISMTLANTMILAGALTILIGLERFAGKKGRHIHNYFLLVAFIAVSSYFVIVQPNLMVRDIALSAVTAIFTFQCCWLLLRRVDQGMRKVTRLTGIVFAGYAAFGIARIILSIIYPPQTSDFFKSGAVDALALTVYIMLSVCLTISLVLMVNRRLLSDVKAQEEKFTTAFHSSPYAITLTRPSDGIIIEVNDGFVNMSGYEHAEVIGKSTLDLDLWVREEDRLDVINELAQGREIHDVEYQFRNKAGKIVTGIFSANLVTINNEICILSSIGDITLRKQMEQQLREMATHDSLTGLPNRTLLYDRCEIAMASAKRNNKIVVIMTLDLDFLKSVNDELGHDMGDRLLVAAAARLTGSLRKSDTVARTGGDEFVILLWEVDHKTDAISVAEKILEDFRKPFIIDGNSLNVTISIGIATYPENGGTIEELLKTSDRLMYTAKQNGRNRLAV